MQSSLAPTPSLRTKTITEEVSWIPPLPPHLPGSPLVCHLCLQEEDAISLNVSVALLDEIFDLGSGSNQWLRRQIMGILKQIIRATFDGKVHRKIKETVDWYTSSEQIASYIESMT